MRPALWISMATMPTMPFSETDESLLSDSRRAMTAIELWFEIEGQGPAIVAGIARSAGVLIRHDQIKERLS